ncbi:MAG: nucleotidyltransferase domain-containing protein [Nitrospirae bacterium]|nr:nucleotidyltransferase domain-containing protein [Nitrospirota bacterium]
MREQDRQTVAEFKKRIPDEIFRHVSSVVVFGSRVRDDAPEDSDLDLLVLVDELALGVEEKLEDIADGVMWDNDFRPVISLKVFSEARYRSALERGFSFYRNVEREGVPV